MTDRPPRPDYLTATREVYALESRAPHYSKEWVVEDFFSAADLAEEQRVWLAAHYPEVEFRIWRYLPDAEPLCSKEQENKR